MVAKLRGDGDFRPSTDLMRVITACHECQRLTAAFVLHTEGAQSLNYLLKSQARSISDLAREFVEPEQAREIAEIAAGRD